MFAHLRSNQRATVQDEENQSSGGYSVDLSDYTDTYHETFNETYEDSFLGARLPSDMENTEGDGAATRRVHFPRMLERPAPAAGQGMPMGFDFGDGPYNSPSTRTITTATSNHTTITTSTTTLTHPSNTQGFETTGYSVSITALPTIPYDPDLLSLNPYKRFMAKTRARRAARERDLHLMAGVELVPNSSEEGWLEGWRKTAVAVGVTIVVLVSTAVVGALVATTSLKERPERPLRLRKAEFCGCVELPGGEASRILGCHFVVFSGIIWLHS
ncbi:hypothetical protein BJ508DRAFT_305918 [Ascobolus immersus RN42]|uniref:Uncharacterized protein n=1 Tax=Ascobolus immersus RN42 TaxID=1160509 RepID=A0A3N4IDE3_ASCIM|nr:hypothetical protein BJ508DRAFT_305918 [Ascobolus immersus RN42]